MRVVITGGLGFIFSHVAEYLSEKGHEVIVMDNLSAGSHPELIPEFKQKHIAFMQADVSFSTIVPAIVALDPDWIIHAAAISDVDASIKNPLKVLTANNNATTNVFEAARACKNLKKLLYVSTDEVYGECDHPKREAEILFPRNAYAVSKAFGSLLRLAYDNTYSNLKDRTVETRFCNVFGPRQDDRKLLPAIKRASQGGAPLQLHNKGMGVRQWIHVNDIPPVIEMLLYSGDRTYNITSGVSLSVLDLLEIAERACLKKIPTVPGKRLGMDMKYQMSDFRMLLDFGWKPSIDVLEALTTYFRS